MTYAFGTSQLALSETFIFTNVLFPKSVLPSGHRKKPNGKFASTTDRRFLPSKTHFQNYKALPRTALNRITNFTPATLQDGSALVHYQLRSLGKTLLKRRINCRRQKIRSPRNGDFTKTCTLWRPSEAYKTIPGDLEYTYFCDLPQTVLDVTNIEGRTWISWKRSLWCTVVYEDMTILLAQGTRKDDGWAKQTCRMVCRTTICTGDLH